MTIRDESWALLDQGGACYDKGMSYSDVADHEKRIECFQEAEQLYLQAAEMGNPYAWQCLGYVYSYDRCEGRYQGFRDDGSGSFSREKSAFECFAHAAEAGLAEAMYKLGDMYKNGIGCEADAQAAFDCYTRAFELGKEGPPVVWGSVALRLGSAFENAFGCTQSFADALKWYKQAVTGLEIAVREGDWYYQKSLSSAKDGVVRCEQELRG